MKKLTIFITLLVFTGLIVAATLYLSKNAGANIQGQAILDNSNNSTGVSLAELASHSSETDCWVAYEEEVFDLTDWLQKHPGGAEVILPTCGTKEKFEQAFTKQHGTSKVQFLVKVGKLMGMLKYEGQLAQ